MDPNTCLFVYLDLQMVGSKGTPLRLYQHLLRRLRTRLHDPDMDRLLDRYLDQDDLDTFDLSDIFDAVDEQGRRIVLLMDEFENIAANPSFGPEFYYGLRSLAIHHNLALVTASQRDLVDLSHSEAVRSSPFFNIFTTIHLRPIPVETAKELLQESLREAEASFTEDEIDLLANLAGGFPFFIQMGGHFLFEAYQEDRAGAPRWDLLETVFMAEAHPHLSTAWQSLADDERTLLLLLAVLETGGDARAATWSVPDLERWYRRSGTLMPSLIRQGLAVESDLRYRLFSPMLTRFVMDEITTPPALPPQPMAAKGEELAVLAALPNALKTRVSRWIGYTLTEYRDLLLTWMADPVTAEATLDLLIALGEMFLSTEERGAEKAPAPDALSPSDPGIRRAIAEAKPGITDWEDVELVVTPRPDPTTFMWLCQWLTETAQGELEEMGAPGLDDSSLSLRVFFYQRVPLAGMLMELPQVEAVRTEEIGEAERGQYLKRRTITSRTTMKKISIPGPSRRLHVALKPPAPAEAAEEAEGSTP